MSVWTARIYALLFLSLNDLVTNNIIAISTTKINPEIITKLINAQSPNSELSWKKLTLLPSAFNRMYKKYITMIVLSKVI